MRVLQVNDYRVAGGCEVAVETTASLLRGAGVETDLLTADDLPGRGRTPLSYVDSPQARRALSARLESFAPDVVHLHNFYHELSPGILAVLGGPRRPRRVVMTAHDYHLVCPNPGRRWFLGDRGVIADAAECGRLGRLLTRRWDHRGAAHSMLRVAQHVWSYRVHDRTRAIDMVLCPSRFMQRAMEPLGLPTAHLPNPAPAGVERGPGDRGAPLTLLYVGRVEPEKGLAEFLGSMPAEFPGRMVVVGDGAGLDGCRQAAPRTVPVAFLGRLSRDGTLEQMRRAHVVVLPSRWPENDPMVLLEAIACGASILVSDLGGSPEIVAASGVGRAYRVERPDTLRAALAEIVEDHARGRLNDFDAAGFLERRSTERYLADLLAVYEGS